MRMDLSKALTRRILHGDISIQQDARGSFVSYDRLEMALMGRYVAVSLMAGGVELASEETTVEDFTRGRLIRLGGLEGRFRIDATRAHEHVRPFYMQER